MVKLCEKYNIHYAWVILAACIFLSAGGTTILINCMGVFIKPVSTALGFSRGSFALFYTCSTLVTTMLSPLVGSLIKRINNRYLLVICSVGVSSMLCGYSFCRELWQFYLCGCCAGIFTGSLTSMAISSIIYRWFVKKRSLAIGIAFAGSGISSMLLNPLTSYIIETVSWQAAFRALAALLLLINVPTAIFLVVHSPEKLGIQPYGAQCDGETEEESLPRGIKRAQAVKIPAFWLLCAAACIGGAIGTGIQQHINAYMTDIGYTPVFAATIFSLVMLFLTGGKLFFGVAFERFGLRFGVVAVCSLLAAASILLLLSGAAWMPYIFSLIFGFGYTILSVPPTCLTGELLGAEDYSANYGIVNFFLCGGMAIGSPISAFIFDLCSSYKPAWLLYGIMALVIMLLYLTTIRRFEALRKSSNVTRESV